MVSGEDEVSILKVKLLSSKDYEYQLVMPEEVHMNIAARRVLRGFHKRDNGFSSDNNFVPYS